MSNTVPVSTKLSPEGVIAELRTVRSQIDEMSPLSQDQRALLKERLRNHPPPVAIIASQAYTIGSQLAKDPAKAVLLPHVEEVKRLKGFARRKKAAPAPAPPPKA